MTYLFIKEVAEKTSAEEVIIVVSTLLKDLNSDNELFRANSLRVLSRILDVRLWVGSQSRHQCLRKWNDISNKQSFIRILV